MNSQRTEHELKKLLANTERPTPPAGLAESIKAEIPDLSTVPALPEAPAAPARRSRMRIYALAASAVVAAGAAFFVYRHQQMMPGTTETVAVEVAADSTSVAHQSAAAPTVATPEASPAGAESMKTAESMRAPATARVAGELPAPKAKRVEPSAMPTAPAEPAPDPAPVWVGGEADITFRGGNPRTEAQDQGPFDGDSAQREQVRRRLERRLADLPRGVQESASAPEPPPPPTVESLRALGYIDSESAPVAENSYAAGVALQAERSELRERRRDLQKRLETLQTQGDAGAAPSPGAAPSTGGNAEPNDKPYGDVFFEDYGTNPFIDTEDDRLSTFALDVDTASYSVVRRFLNEGHMPEDDAVRVEEMINYFDYGDAPPEEKDVDFALHAEGAPSLYGEGERYYLMRFHLRGRDLADEDRKPADLTFVVDVSGSMNRENRLGLVRKALGLLLDELRPDDRVALVVYGSQGRVLLEHTSDHEAIRSAIGNLVSEGSTNAEEGLRLAYEMASRQGTPGRINRVILCSDGVANVGRTGPDSILEQIERYAKNGVELTTVGFGMGNYNDVLMEQLANKGNGRYAYVDNLDEARRIFVENLTGTLETIAAEARTQVEWNPELVTRYRLIGYENRDVADERFRDDTVDAGEIGAGHKVTVLYEVKLARPPRRNDRIGVLRLRYASMQAGEFVEQERPVFGRDFVNSWETASPALRLTSLVAEFGEILSESYWARNGDLDDVFRRTQQVSSDFAGDHDVAELVGLVSSAARLKER